MNNRTLGIIGMIGAPFLLIDTVNNGFEFSRHSSISGLFNLIYITAWMCTMIALRRLGALGEQKSGTVIFILQMAFLSLANCWNFYELIQPGAGTQLYYILDVFWPVSNLFMFVTGIIIAVKGVLEGWKRYVPLMVGCWLPISLLCWAIFSRTPGMLLFVNIYSAVMWTLMAMMVVLSCKKSVQVEGLFTAESRPRPAILCRIKHY